MSAGPVQIGFTAEGVEAMRQMTTAASTTAVAFSKALKALAAAQPRFASGGVVRGCVHLKRGLAQGSRSILVEPVVVPKP